MYEPYYFKVEESDANIQEDRRVSDRDLISTTSFIEDPFKARYANYFCDSPSTSKFISRNSSQSKFEVKNVESLEVSVMVDFSKPIDSFEISKESIFNNISLSRENCEINREPTKEINKQSNLKVFQHSSLRIETISVQIQQSVSTLHSTEPSPIEAPASKPNKTKQKVLIKRNTNIYKKPVSQPKKAKRIKTTNRNSVQIDYKNKVTALNKFHKREKSVLVFYSKGDANWRQPSKTKKHSIEVSKIINNPSAKEIVPSKRIRQVSLTRKVNKKSISPRTKKISIDAPKQAIRKRSPKYTKINLIK